MTYTGTVLLLSPSIAVKQKQPDSYSYSDRESLVNGQMGNNQYK